MHTNKRVPRLRRPDASAVPRHNTQHGLMQPPGLAGFANQKSCLQVSMNFEDLVTYSQLQVSRRFSALAAALTRRSRHGHPARGFRHRISRDLHGHLRYVIRCCQFYVCEKHCVDSGKPWLLLCMPVLCQQPPHQSWAVSIPLSSIHPHSSRCVAGIVGAV